MIRVTATRRRWGEPLRLGMAVPLLFAFVLAEVVSASRIPPGTVGDSSDRSSAARDWADAAAMRPSSQTLPRVPATVDLAGWRVDHHASTPQIPIFGLILADGLLGGGASIRGGWTVVAAATVSAPRFYRPQAPPIVRA